MIFKKFFWPLTRFVAQKVFIDNKFSFNRTILHYFKANLIGLRVNFVRRDSYTLNIWLSVTISRTETRKIYYQQLQQRIQNPHAIYRYSVCGSGADPGFAKGGAHHGERAEREPITGVWGEAPSGVQGQSPWWGVKAFLAIFILKRDQMLSI